MLTLHGLWRHANFRRLWLARTISGLGSEITYLALPLIAAGILNATPTQMGVLSAAATAPYLLWGLFAGVWVDRLRRRPLMIAADLGRALLVGSVPLVALTGEIGLAHLYAVAFMSGTLGLLYGVADEALLPSLLRRDELVEGNSKLAISAGVTEGAGSGIASVLAQTLGAPLAVAVDALSYMVSALLLGRIDMHETPAPRQDDASVWRELGAGLGFVWRQPVLRATTASSAILQLTGGISDALFVLYITRTLGLPPTVIGAFFAVAGVVALVSATVTPRLTRRIGVGPALVVGALGISAAWIAVYLAAGPPPLVIAMIVGGGIVGSFGNTTYNITLATLTQAITPHRMLGRVGAAAMFIGMGALPLGALIGGALASMIDVRPTLLVAGVGRLPPLLWILFGALWPIKQPPMADEEVMA